MPNPKPKPCHVIPKYQNRMRMRIDMKKKLLGMAPGRKCQTPNPQNAQSSTLHFNGLVYTFILKTCPKDQHKHLTYDMLHAQCNM